jgi:capsular polysaccharide biosynthesis protein
MSERERDLVEQELVERRPANPNGDRPEGDRPDGARRPFPRTLLVIGALVALGATGGVAFALTASDEYRAPAFVLVSAPPGVADNGSAVGLAHAYARVALQQAVVGPALAVRGLPWSDDYLRRSLTVNTSPDAPIVEIVGHAPSAAGATELADLASRAFVDYLDQVGRDTGYHLTLLSPAGAAQAPGSPGVPLSLAVGAVAGAALGTGWRLLRA